MWCAASPARNTRPARNRSATCAAAVHGATPRISTSRSETPAAWRTSAAQRSGVYEAMSALAGKLLTRNPQRLTPLMVRNVARKVGLLDEVQRRGTVCRPGRQIGVQQHVDAA